MTNKVFLSAVYFWLLIKFLITESWILIKNRSDELSVHFFIIKFVSKICDWLCAYYYYFFYLRKQQKWLKTGQQRWCSEKKNTFLMEKSYNFDGLVMFFNLIFWGVNHAVRWQKLNKKIQMSWVALKILTQKTIWFRGNFINIICVWILSSVFLALHCPAWSLIFVVNKCLNHLLSFYVLSSWFALILRGSLLLWINPICLPKTTEGLF